MERFGLILAASRIRNAAPVIGQPTGWRNQPFIRLSMANKPINPDTWDEYETQGDVEQIPNKERGCGYLKAGNAYIRCDPSSFSEGGALPGFVAIVDDNGDLHPIPYKESLPRGYETINGTNFLAAAETIRNFQPLYPGGPDASESHQEAHERALQNMVDAGAYPSVDAVPASELSRHLDRMAIDGIQSEHWGAMKPANSKDLMMRVGKSYYDEPWDYIDETLELGLNKGISVHSNKKPPVIQEGRTRCWLIHPHACGEDMPGVIGFSYLTRCIFTRDKDGNVPKYAQDYGEAGHLDVVEIGEPEPLEEDDERDYDDIAEQHQGLDEFEPEEGRQSGTEPTRLADAPETVPVDGDADGGESVADAVQEAIESSLDPQQMEELEKADLGELAGEGWLEAATPPEEQDVLQGGGIIGIVHQDGGPRKVSASNNWKFDEDAGLGSTRLGPYTVELEANDSGRQIRVKN